MPGLSGRAVGAGGLEPRALTWTPGSPAGEEAEGASLAGSESGSHGDQAEDPAAEKVLPIPQGSAFFLLSSTNP